MTYQELEKINGEIKTIPLTQKVKNEKGYFEEKTVEYVEVKERIKAFRKLYPNGQLITSLISIDNEHVIFQAQVYDDNKNLIATGHAREQITNKKFPLENCETSAIGRALAGVGIGIQNAIASAEDMEKTESPSGLFDERIVTPAEIKTYADDFRELFSKEKQVEILNGYGVLKAEDIDFPVLQAYVNKKRNEIKTNQNKGNIKGN